MIAGGKYFLRCYSSAKDILLLSFDAVKKLL